MIDIVRGNLLDASEEYICQQCNCVSVRPRGLASQISMRYPYADVYGKRRAIGRRNLAIDSDRSIPGTIEVCGSDRDRKIICMFAQYNVSKPSSNGDSHQDRLIWFERCLKQISDLEPKSVAFPYMIGCGLAGGDWNAYLSLISKWSEQHPEISIKIYKL